MQAIQTKRTCRGKMLTKLPREMLNNPIASTSVSEPQRSHSFSSNAARQSVPSVCQGPVAKLKFHLALWPCVSHLQRFCVAPATPPHHLNQHGVKAVAHMQLHLNGQTGCVHMQEPRDFALGLRKETREAPHAQICEPVSSDTKPLQQPSSTNVGI